MMPARFFAITVLVALLFSLRNRFAKAGRIRDHRFQETAFAMEKNPEWKAVRYRFERVNVRERGFLRQFRTESGGLKELLRQGKSNASRKDAASGMRQLVQKLQDECESAELRQFLKDAEALR